MEFFVNAKSVRLRSCHNKYLVAEDDGESVKQSRNGHSREARWEIEMVQDKTNMIRLRSCNNKFLTATDQCFLLGWTGQKALQTLQPESDPSVYWEVIREKQYYVKLRALRTGKNLRANCGTPPWRNTVTVDVPERSSTQDWILWSVDVLDDVAHYSWPGNCKSLPPPIFTTNASNYNSSYSMATDIVQYRSSSSSAKEDEKVVDSTSDGNESLSGWSSTSVSQAHSRAYKGGMELFQNAKTVRLRGHHDKYLLADDDEENVVQERHGVSRRARWTVEYVKSVEGVNLVRLQSCYGKYLTATDDEFLLGVTGKKVKQTVPRRLDSSVEWEALRDGMEVKLKTRYGNFLRANGGLPPWRNSITHDVPSRSHTQDWILWEVEVLEVYDKVPEPEANSGGIARCESEVEPFSFQSHVRSESGGSGVKEEGRVILYNVVDDDGNIVDEDEGGCSIVFKGNGVRDLTQMLEETTGLTDVTLCTRSVLNDKFYPMRLAFPPHHVKLHIYVVPASSKAMADFA